MGCLIIKKVWMKYDNIMMMKLNERVLGKTKKWQWWSWWGFKAKK